MLEKELQEHMAGSVLRAITRMQDPEVGCTIPLHGVGGSGPSCVAKSLFWMTFVFTAVIRNCDPKQQFKTASGIRQQWTTCVAKLREITNRDHVHRDHVNHAKFVISRDYTSSRSQCVIHRLSPRGLIGECKVSVLTLQGLQFLREL